MSLVSTLIVFLASLALLVFPYRLTAVTMEFCDSAIAVAASLMAAALTATQAAPLGAVELTRVVLWTAVLTHALLLAWHFTEGVPDTAANANRGTRTAGATFAACSAALLLASLSGV